MSQQPKRKKDGGSEEMTGREKKKVRMAEARTIPVQSVGAGSSSQAGPSKVVPMNSLAGLPSAIDIEKVVESRAFEIGAMQTAMKTASAGSTQRAWQALPRHLRRRAASHDVRRVPQRLRGRALAEMDALPVKKKKLPQRGKSKQETRTESFLRRQKDKTWLETHVWHSKRMIMEDMWGYRLAVKPTEKAYRPSHRASVQGAIIHDASYYSLVELRGAPETIIGTLNLCCDPQGPSPGALRFLNGTRTYETHAYEPGSYPLGLIAPLSIFWQPATTSTDIKGKGKETDASAPNSQENDRAIWLRYHPAVRQQMLSALQKAASTYLARKKEEGIESVEIQICDLKDQINVFEIMGPQASQVIRGVLNAVPGDPREEFKQFWSSLADVQTSGSVPRNLVVGFKVLDPRLRFPPKRAKPKPGKPINTHHIFPKETLARSDIWDEKVRLGLARPKFTKQELDDRRAKNVVPGTPLNPQRQDDRVPVLLIQRSLEASRTAGGHPIHGWTLIVPSGWGMAFWSSLVFTGTRIAGQRERQTQAYEAGTTYFPRDYPFTDAYNQFSKQREEKLKEKWDRKPPAKKPNFKKLEVDDPWTPNWNKVLGIEAEKDKAEEGDLVPAQREPESESSGVKPWLLRGLKMADIVEKVAASKSPEECLLSELNKLRVARSLEQHPVTRAQELLRGALINVKVNVCKRGLPQDLGLIYALEDDEVPRAMASITRKGDPEDEDEDEFNGISTENTLIGRITTGNYSLSIGSGYAVGAVPLARWLALLKQQPEAEKNTPSTISPLVKIRNTNSDQCRLAKLEVLVEGDA
ncbi:hypothetical protein D9611_008747 [Ephemerocybe angulata]|uniref:Uncharacterized protein n=1 Tax=Ephemerocybe angulata TaxID=980116 RepID=A0A8H5CCG3_9AGAR|nr:hypothetical protein D9611_008747 [Tulosesus angulatus]